MKTTSIFLATLFVSGAAFAGISQTGEQKSSTPSKPAESVMPATTPEKSLIKPEVDKTDVLAIPIDTSEVEEQEEEQSLESLEKYEQTKKTEDVAHPAN